MAHEELFQKMADPVIAGEGAKIALLSDRERNAAELMTRRVEYLELSGRTDFNDLFMAALGFPSPPRPA